MRYCNLFDQLFVDEFKLNGWPCLFLTARKTLVVQGMAFHQKHCFDSLNFWVHSVSTYCANWGFLKLILFELDMYLQKVNMYRIWLVLTAFLIKSVQVMVRLRIFPIFSFLAKTLSFRAKTLSFLEMTTFLPEMKISEKYASGP